MRPVTYVVVDSRYGRLYVAEGAAGIVLARRLQSATEFEREALSALGCDVVPATDGSGRAAALHRWLEGEPRLAPPFDLEALPPFAQAALRKTATIPFGEVRPYGWVAKEVGRPAAARAVGTALGRNPIDLLIPCHRVVSGDGRVGPYGRSGEATKRSLLACEGVDVDRLDAYARAGIRFLGDASTGVACYPTCRCVIDGRPENLVPFGSLGRAVDDGFAPCARCRPAHATRS